MQDIESLAAEFIANVNQIASTLVESFGLRHTSTIDNLANPVLRWLDFRLRFIDPRPRQIHFSDRFPMALDEATRVALHAIEAKIIKGEDINPHQGTGLLDFDTSGKRKAARTDMLWAEWGVHHLHLALPRHPKKSYFSSRADFLLFVIFGLDYALFIDILPHSGDDLLFARDKLIQVVAKNWPEWLDQFKLKGVLGLEREINDEQRKQLRNSGITSPVTIDGSVYLGPGQGLTSAATSGRASLCMIRLQRNLANLARYVLEPTSQFWNTIPVARRPETHFSLQLSPEGIMLFERETNQGWRFPEARSDGTDTLFSEISGYLAPSWVIESLAALPPPEQSDTRQGS